MLPRRELPLGGVGAPLSLTCCPTSPYPVEVMKGLANSNITICVALSKEYIIIDAVSGDVVLIPSISSHSLSPPSTNAIVVPFPASSVRGPRLLLTTTGSTGVLVDVQGVEQEEIISWSEAPVALQLSAVFLLAALPQQVEIHDCATLTPIQTLNLTGTAVCMTACMMVGGRGPFGYVGTTNSIQLLKMIPIQFQVEELVGEGKFVEALTLCEMCKTHDEQQKDIVSPGRTGIIGDDTFLQNIEVELIRERYARDLLLSGDYDGAVSQFLKANAGIQNVVCFFPSLMPPDLPIYLMSSTKDDWEELKSLYSTSDMQELSHAASALARFLEKRRMECVAEADREECQGAATTVRNEVSGSEDSRNAVRTAELLDTVLVYAYLRCSPPRSQIMIDVLSSEEITCRCNFDAIAPVLSGGGLLMLEPLLWLYRSKGQHAHALGLLSEEHCVGSGKGTLKADSEGEGVWTRDYFWQWTAEYLQSLWFSPNPVHPSLVLEAAVTRHLFGTRPDLGLTVFTGSDCKGGKLPSGTRAEAQRPPLEHAISPQQTVSFLKSVTLSPAASIVVNDKDGDVDLNFAGGDHNEIPLTTGRALAIAYLEHLVNVSLLSPPPLSEAGTGAALNSQQNNTHTAVLSNFSSSSIPTSLAVIHDELAYLLMEGVLAEQQSAAEMTMVARGGTFSPPVNSDEGVGGATEPDTQVVALYRQKLRHFLQTSQHYNPARLLAVVPPEFLLEHALLLSRLGRHTEVLEIYVVQLRDRELAEKYCDRIWREQQHQQQCNRQFSAASSRASTMDDATLPSGDVYICLLQVYMRGNEGRSGGRKEREEELQPVLDILTQFYDRIDPVKAMNLLPLDLPLVKLQPFLTATLRHHESRRCMAQVTRHLNRADFMNVKYETTQLQSQVSRVPELELSFEYLGKLVRSLPTEEVLEAGGGSEYRLTCTQHDFDDHLVLQFGITNTSEDVRLSHASIRCDPSDPDLLVVAGERPLEAVPPLGCGSCYVVRG